jgi:hypothetical protein
VGLGLMGVPGSSSPRTWAEKLLRAMLWLAPAERRDWVEAMLRELDFIGLDAGLDKKGGDWAALFWALGCTGAIFRESLRGWGAWLWKQFASLFGIRTTEEENKMNSTGKKTLGVLAGVGMALALGVTLFFLKNVIADMLLAVGIPRTMWTHILSVIVPAEAIVVVAAVLLWRRRLAPVAVGLLLTGFVMAAHVVVILVGR